MERVITVKGVGNASIQPDTILLKIELETSHSDYQKSLDIVMEKQQRVIDAVIQAGFRAEELKTASFNIETEYQERRRNGNDRNVPVSWHCEQQLKLAFPIDRERFSRVMQCLAESNAECSLNIQYTLSDPGRLQPMLIESAAANARKKALALCAAQGVKLGELLRIDCDWQEISISSGSRFSRDVFAPVLACAIAKFSPEEIHAGDTATFIWAIESDPGNP